MALQFPNLKYAQISASWLDNVSSMSIMVRVRFDSINTASSQFIFRHRNGTTGNQFSLRKEIGVGSLIKASVTCDAANDVVLEESTTAMVAGTIHDIAMVWQKNVAAPNGLRLWIDGVQEGGGSSTTTQTEDYNTTVGSLFLGARSGPGEYGICTIERFAIFPGLVLTQGQIDAFRLGTWPCHIGDLPRPAAFYPMFSSDATRIQDYSGNGRTIESGGITGPLTTSPGMGLWMDPSQFGSGFISAPTSGGASQNPWTVLSPDIDVPITSALVSGLTNTITYEFKINTIDNQGNISPDSDVKEATPTSVTATTTTPVPWRRNRVLSKFRSGSQ